MEFKHIPVLAGKTIELLNIKPDGVYIDGTAGGGGHSELIAKRLTDNGRLLSLDRDPDALKTASERLEKYKNVSVVQGNFADMAELAPENDVNSADGILLDIGVSSYQLDEPARGFSYHADAPLDMRMEKSGVSAADLVNTLPPDELARILFEYGEEKFAHRIVAEILKAREASPITKTSELAELVSRAYPAAQRRKGHPARQTFQALRIAVNSELDCLSKGMDGAFSLLKTGGVLAIITFHSLEDRAVKQRFASWCKGCTCPPEFPVCVCGKKPQGRLVNKKPVEADENELNENPRSRTAKLRVIEKIV